MQASAWQPPTVDERANALFAITKMFELGATNISAKFESKYIVYNNGQEPLQIGQLPDGTPVTIQIVDRGGGPIFGSRPLRDNWYDWWIMVLQVGTQNVADVKKQVNWHNAGDWSTSRFVSSSIAVQKAYNSSYEIVWMLGLVFVSGTSSYREFEVRRVSDDRSVAMGMASGWLDPWNGSAPSANIIVGTIPRKNCISQYE